MKNAEKDLRASYALCSKEELQEAIFKDEASLRSPVRRLRDKINQNDVESRIAILKDMLYALYGVSREG
jgi:hypothetical protein